MVCHAGGVDAHGVSGSERVRRWRCRRRHGDADRQLGVHSGRGTRPGKPAGRRWLRQHVCQRGARRQTAERPLRALRSVPSRTGFSFDNFDGGQTPVGTYPIVIKDQGGFIGSTISDLDPSFPHQQLNFMAARHRQLDADAARRRAHRPELRCELCVRRWPALPEPCRVIFRRSSASAGSQLNTHLRGCKKDAPRGRHRRPFRTSSWRCHSSPARKFAKPTATFWEGLSQP